MHPSDPTHLRRFLRGVITTTLAATSAGCGPSWPSEGDAWEVARCTNGAWTPIVDLQPALPYDHIRVATATVDGPPQIHDSFGEACSGAEDVPACQSIVDTLVAATYTSYVLTTQGNTVRTWVGAEDVAELLAPIDTHSEAMMMAWSKGDWVTCDDLDLSASREVEDGWETVSTSYREICAPLVRIRSLRHVASDGTVELLDEQVIERSSACIGRRPPGLAIDATSSTTPGDAAGRWLARAAALEAASVQAFEQLACELEALGAPTALIADARRFAADEVRHAAIVGDLALRYGESAPEVAIAPTPPRALESLALDNAVEGCVRETWGALLGAWQAATATDPAVARALAAIAEDEARHAALAWRIAAWADGELSSEARARVAHARARAAAELASEAAAPLPAELRGPLGLPDVPSAQALWAQMSSQLWAA